MEIKLNEISALDDVKQTQLSQAQTEFFKLDDELRMMLEKLTLVQRMKVNEMVADFISRQDMNQ